MSSNDHIKFKTDATQKVSTDTEIISDTIILPPYSTDHVLTVTAPTAASNLTGQVDVELEMSPDGENWCAAVTSEYIASEGGGTPVDGAATEDANLKAISTIPDSQNVVGQYKNKFALGALSADDNGVETTDAGAYNSYTKDFMHKFISKDKPFNYSLWLKTNTDEQAFGDDYTPVLFRHGGKDKFTNSNVVKLTDSITLFEEDAYAEMPTDGPIVYEADFPISNVEGTTWYLGLSRAFTPGYNGLPEDNGGFTIEIGDKVAGNYIKWEVRDTNASTSFFINGTASINGLPQRSSRPNFTYSNCSNYSTPNTLWLCHPAWSGTQSSFYHRYQLFSSDTPCYKTEQTSQSLPTSLDDPFALNTTNKITVTFDSSTQATRVLRNLIIYTTEESTLFDTAQGDRRSAKFNSPLAGKELGDTPIASWNFGLNSNGVIKDGAGSNDMSVTYSGSQTIEKTGLKNIIGSSVIRKSFTGANKQIKFNGTGPFGGTNGGVPSLAGGWAAAFDPAVIVSTSSFNARLIQLYTGASTSFNIRRNQSAINVVINGVTHTMSGIDTYTGAFLVVCEPYTLDGVTSISSKLTTYYIPKEVNLHTATISDLVSVPCTINATAYGSDWAFNPSSSYSYLNTDQANGSRLNTSAFFNTGTSSLTDQDKLDILIGMEMPSLVNLNNLNVGLTALYNYNTNYDGTYLYDETGSGVNPYASVPSGLNISSRESLQDGTPSTQNLCEPATLPFSSVFSASNNFSISGWFKTTDVGTLFSNTDAATGYGMKCDVTAQSIVLTVTDATTTHSYPLLYTYNDDEWHHVLFSYTSYVQMLIVDGKVSYTDTLTLTDDHLKGSNGFTLLGDGSNNANATGPVSTDTSKLNASLSNWSIHSENLGAGGASALYSRGHVRNIKNLPSVNPANIVAWWQLNDSANPEQDLSGNGYDLVLQDGASLPLTDYVVEITEGAPLILEEDQYGSGITMSLTKRFDPTDPYGINQWKSTHNYPTSVCLSFNGFEDQAEYWAVYTPSIDIADNEWHNLILSFSGKEGSSTNTTSNLSFSAAKHNFVISVDGTPFEEAIVGSLDSNAGTPFLKEFPASERHLKFVTNDQEDYMPHAQLNSNIFESINQSTQKYEPVVAKNYKTSFIGYADESSFHSESWFVNAAGVPTTTFNDQKPATMFGNTSTLSNRGVNSTVYGEGKPYPLPRPSVIGVDPSTTGNQYIDPNKYDVSTNPDGGLEAWWRWGDTDGDCSVNINDNIGFSATPINPSRSLIANNYIADINQTTQIAEDLFFLTESDSIYVPEGTTPTGGGNTLSYIPVIIETIQAGVCNLKNLTSPLLQYIRVKFTNSGEAQLGEDKVEASIHYRKRR